MARKAAAREPITAWLGEEIRLIKGQLSFEGSLRIDGTIVDGRLSGPTLIVGQGARVSGRIEVQSLVVYGHVEGRVRVKESATIATGGVFAGEMVLDRPVLTVEDGGLFEGRVRLARARTEPAAATEPR